MPRARWLLLVTSLLLLAPSPVRAAGETKEFKDKNFKLTTPNDSWEWMDVSPDAKGYGYVAKLMRNKDGATATVSVRVVPTNGLSLDELTQEVVDNASSLGVSKVEGSAVHDGLLSGIRASQVIVKGTDGSGVPVLVRVWSTVSKGLFHQLICQFRGEGDKTLAGEVDALRRAYRLLEGAGPEEPADESGSAEPDPKSAGSADSWPEHGPKREGNAALFPHYNLKWAVPADSPLKWRAVISDEAKVPESGGVLLGALAAKAERKAEKEGEPTEVYFEVRLLAAPARPGVDANHIAESDNVQSNISEHVFDKVVGRYTKAVTDATIGNVKGAQLIMAGWKDREMHYRVWNFVVLQRFQYELQLDMYGWKDARVIFAGAAKDIVASLQFLDTTEWITGPAGIPEVPPFNQSRGTGEGKEEDVTSLGFTAKKPEDMSSLLDPGGRGDLKVAWEVRSEDKQSYLYFDVASIAYQPNMKDPEQSYIDQRANTWKDAVASPEVNTKGKANSFKDKWGRGKGLGYEFTGTLRDAPFSERGYVVRYKQYIYVIRIQLGGKNAEHTFSSVLRDLKRAVKF